MKKEEKERMASESWKLSSQLLDTLKASDLAKTTEVNPGSILAAIGEFTAIVLEAMQNSTKGGPNLYEFYKDKVLPAHHEGVWARMKLDMEKEVS